MNKTLLIALLVLPAACDKLDISPSQADSFIKFYNTYPVFTGADIKEMPGGGFAVIGTVKSYDSGNQICLIRTDKYGNSIDSARYFGGPLDEEAFCLQVLDDHSLAILGSSVNPDNSKKEVYFIHTDSIGNVIWSKYIKGTGNIEAYHFEVTAAGNFVMTGYADTVKSGVLNKDIWLYGLNADSNPSWPKPRCIGGTRDDIGRHLQLLSSGNIVVTGESQSNQLEKLYRHSFVLQTNPSGLGPSILFTGSSRDESGNCIRVLSDNSFLILGTINNNTSGSGNDIVLKKVTVSGTLHEDWVKTFGENGNDYGQCAIIDDNSLHLLVTMSASNINSSIALITTDMDGNVPVYTNLGDDTELIGNAIIKTSDNGFIILGTNKHSEDDISMTLIKLKPDGTL